MSTDATEEPAYDGQSTPWKRRISREDDSGFLWFLETSYQYMMPRGFHEHVSFLARFPGCWIGFRRSMRSHSLEQKDG